VAKLNSQKTYARWLKISAFSNSFLMPRTLTSHTEKLRLVT
jgi:hypothetical protein